MGGILDLKLEVKNLFSLFFLQISQLDEDECPGLSTICRHLHLIPDAGNQINLNVTFSLSSLIHNVDVDKFYTYKGKIGQK